MGKPQLKIKVKEGKNIFVSEYLCDSIVVDDTKYVAQYSTYNWQKNNIIENGKNPQVKLPNGDVISEKEFKERFVFKKEILI